MKLNSLQKKVDDWIKKYGVRYFDENTDSSTIYGRNGACHAAFKIK